MNVLQEVFEESLQELEPEFVVALLIQQKFREKGIILSESQLLNIQQKFKEYENGPFIIDLDIESSQKDEEIFIDLTENSIDDLLFEILRDWAKEVAEEILQTLKERLSELLKERDKDRKVFESHLYKVWGEAFALLEMLLHLSLEAGEDFNREFREEMANEQNFVFDVLTRLHARACQVSSEILILLKAGYADGAHARWRSLHEITVMAFFITKHGNEVAEKYLLHDNIESYKAALLYQKYYERLGMEPLSQREKKELKEVYDALLKRFGPSYRFQYGWASSALNKKNPTFRDIEEDVSLDHLHPYYKLASHNIHANPKGVFFRLGLYPQQDDVLLAGPSNTGLADPASGTALSLSQITITLLTMKTNMDRLVLSNILLMLVDEITEKFLSVQNSLESL